jgi:outer membrane receptor protein involved in Fe transport
MRSVLRQRLLTSTLLVGALGVATPAWAQPADEDVQENAVQVSQDDDAGEGTESITVTGSRIQRRDLTSSSPLTVVQDEEFKLSGSVNVEQVINTLPQVIPGTTSFSNNPGGGFATLDLRGLGSTRTLVLVNGRRYVFFDVSQRVDLNTIPAFLLDSVDVVTGGASAVYGSDALSGVVNFRLKQDLNGVEAGASMAITEQGDGARFNTYLALGADFADGRGNVTVFGEYFKRKSIFQGDRSFSRIALNDGATGLVPGGSATTPQGRFAVPATSAVPGLNLSCWHEFLGSWCQHYHAGREECGLPQPGGSLQLRPVQLSAGSAGAVPARRIRLLRDFGRDHGLRRSNLHQQPRRERTRSDTGHRQRQRHADRGGGYAARQLPVGG